MPKSLKKYADPMKALQYRNEQRKLNYSGTIAPVKKTRTVWNAEEDKMVLDHEITDRELSAIIGKTIEAIQIHRCRLKKKLKA